MSDRRQVKEKEIFTTYDVARICGANVASIKNWMAKGMLRSFRTPGGHYRVRRRDLELFARKYNMPFPFARRERRVYAADSDPEMLARIRRAVDGHAFAGFSDLAELALVIGLERPDVLVFDPGQVRNGEIPFLDVLLRHAETRNIRVVLVTSSLTAAQATAVRRTYNLEDIASRSGESQELEEALSRALG